MIQAIVFDLYGVLAINGWQAFKAEHFSEREHIWDQVFELGKKVDAGLADYQDLVRYTAAQSGESEATVSYQLEHTVANHQLLDYISGELSGRYKLGILSNASSNKVIDQILTKEQEAMFDAIVLSHHVGLVKPQVEMYHAVAGRLGTGIASCLFVDDQQRHVAGARAAGMQGMVYTDLTALKEAVRNLS